MLDFQPVDPGVTIYIVPMVVGVLKARPPPVYVVVVADHAKRPWDWKGHNGGELKLCLESSQPPGWKRSRVLRLRDIYSWSFS